jgi:signal transduction histidine kinase
MADAKGCTTLAVLLREQSTQLLERWRQRVLEDPAVPAADRLSQPSLLDHFPALVARLARGLDGAATTDDRSSLVGRRVGQSEASHAHAAERFASGFTLEQVLRELAHLRLAILELCARAGVTVTLDCSLLIQAGIDEMMVMGAREMARLDREAIEEQARVAKREHARAEEASRMKDLFLATLSHELRTPLNAILGWTRMLRTKAVAPGHLERALEAIERNSFAQAHLVDELLDMSRITSGKIQVDRVRVDVVSLVRAAVESVQPNADTRQVTVDITGEYEAFTHGDVERLKQVFWNLLANAIKFSKAGDRVQIAVSKGERSVRVSVIDQGIGIEPEFIERIFERFQQGDASPARSHGGLGLGLAIVRELVELHDGNVEVTSDGKGKGATFVVTLPLA